MIVLRGVVVIAIAMRRDVLFASCLGLGKLPLAPGTWASLPPVVLYQVLGYLGPFLAVGPLVGLGPFVNSIVMALFVLAGVWAYWACAGTAWEGLGPKTLVVADCWAGQSLTMLMIALWRPIEICNSMALGFALFRLLDLSIAALPLPRLNQTTGVRPLLRRLAIGAVAGGIALMVMATLPQYFD
jgi:phosphatidylglycerophosphatase A